MSNGSQKIVQTQGFPNGILIIYLLVAVLHGRQIANAKNLKSISKIEYFDGKNRLIADKKTEKKNYIKILSTF